MTTDKKFNAFKSKTSINAKKYSERLPNIKYHPIIKRNYLNDAVEWVKISFIYNAEGFENYFSIGNFNSNSMTEKNKIPF